jgi:ubiquinone/menaquinone biosynthesis C-methylase UbiE
MSANYNNAAWFYDRLASLVFGRALINTQVYLLQYIPQKANILIVGGGTGWILEEIARKHQAGLSITYVEVSDNMIGLSKKRNAGVNTVVFINDAIENVTVVADFDIVLTPFLFDNFTERTLKEVFNHIDKMLKPDALWLNADFQLTGKWWQPLLLKIMFLFFRALCHIEAKQLPKIERCFIQNNYYAIAHKTFFNYFMMAKVYQKSV